MRRLARLTLCLGTLLATVARAEDPAEVTLRLAPDPVALGDAATLEIQVTSSGFGGPEVVPRFELENLDRLSGPFQAQSHRWVNGKTSSSLQLIWRLRPRALGRARVHSVRVDVDGRTYSLPDQEVDVVDSPPPTATPQPLPSSPFPKDPFEGLFTPPPSTRRRLQQEPKVNVRVEVDPPSPYVGQQVQYRLVLYTQTDISAFNPLGLPDFRGFWAREVELPQKSRPDWVEIGGERFGKVVMLQRALYPLQSGKLRIEPIDVELVQRVADSGFFGPFGRDVPKTIRTRETVLDVQPLPPAPAGFEGLVGDLTAEAALDRERVEVGQAATYKLSVESRGNLQGLAAPELDLPPGLVAYPPRPESSEKIQGGSILARREWSYVLVPSQPGDYEIPAVTLTRFDPRAGEYRTIDAAAVRLEVVGSSEATPTPAPTPDPATPAAPSRLEVSPT
ncbi:MAG: protein BatD, partial [Acidobacteria bacterium]|nr:protein BatD [Acidobacteriota bacterium]